MPSKTPEIVITEGICRVLLKSYQALHKAALTMARVTPCRIISCFAAQNLGTALSAAANW